MAMAQNPASAALLPMTWSIVAPRNAASMRIVVVINRPERGVNALTGNGGSIETITVIMVPHAKVPVPQAFAAR